MKENLTELVFIIDCQGFVILGYIDGEQPVSKPGKPGRVQIIDLYDFRQRKKIELHETSVFSI